MNGHIHSLESFGTVDGPGIRFVVFLQGCPMRCAYCHNPDTWDMNKGSVMEVSTIMKSLLRNRNFYQDGGITVTGGEPMMQPDFLIELFTACKEQGIHTCIDTSGIAYEPTDSTAMKQLNTLLPLTDLIMLDIKHIDPCKHQELTGKPNESILAFAQYLALKNIPVWIRHVIVPGITDDEDSLHRLGLFIGTLPNVQALDVLPYHSMGRAKYEQLGIDYRLKDIPDMDPESLLCKKQIILDAIRWQRLSHNS
ncbi:MAG: pyruvate formate-lyase-activating protein [Lachnospiraceae bacterium]